MSVAPPTSYDLLISQSSLPRLEARMLLELASQRGREWLVAHGDEPAMRTVVEKFDELCQRRLRGEPMAYLIGAREFFGRLFVVTPEVLIPRPETELLIERALTWLPTGGRVIDLGTGSGCIAITLACERPDALVLGTDRSAAALAVAWTNARRLCPAKPTTAGSPEHDQLSFLQSNWWQALADTPKFDLIVSNPPYIGANDAHLAAGDLRFEPREALTDRFDGLSALAAIVSGAPEKLTSGGHILLEHGFDQGEAVRRMLREAGFSDIMTSPDAAGLPRVSEGRLLARPPLAGRN